MQTNERLASLKYELLIQESKFLWKWNKNELPKNLKTNNIRKNDRLKGRRFVISRTLKSTSINSRLACLANKIFQKLPIISDLENYLLV
jgi:hypothetical protein